MSDVACRDVNLYSFRCFFGCFETDRNFTLLELTNNRYVYDVIISDRLRYHITSSKIVFKVDSA